MSTRERRHEIHMFAAFGSIVTLQMQHRVVGSVDVNSMLLFHAKNALCIFPASILYIVVVLENGRLNKFYLVLC